jgi:hypothetical protein
MIMDLGHLIKFRRDILKSHGVFGLQKWKVIVHTKLPCRRHQNMWMQWNITFCNFECFVNSSETTHGGKCIVFVGHCKDEITVTTLKNDYLECIIFVFFLFNS